jgi:hypothetical protein
MEPDLWDILPTRKLKVKQILTVNSLSERADYGGVKNLLLEHTPRLNIGLNGINASS